MAFHHPDWNCSLAGRNELTRSPMVGMDHRITSAHSTAVGTDASTRWVRAPTGSSAFAPPAFASREPPGTGGGGAWMLTGAPRIGAHIRPPHSQDGAGEQLAATLVRSQARSLLHRSSHPLDVEVHDGQHQHEDHHREG